MNTRLLILVALLICGPAEARYWKDIIDFEVRSAAVPKFGDGTGQVIVIIDKGWYDVDHPDFLAHVPRFENGDRDACFSAAQPGEQELCGGLLVGDHAAEAKRQLNGNLLYRAELSGSVEDTWHGDLMAWVANYVAPGAKFILIKIGVFSTDTQFALCRRKNFTTPDWCWAARNTDIEAALEYIRTDLISSSGAGLDPNQVTVLLSLGDKSGRKIDCPVSDPEFVNLYDEYAQLDFAGVAIHVAAGNYGEQHPNGHGVTATACSDHVFANGGYWAGSGPSNMERDWRSGSGAMVYAASRYNGWQFNFDLNVLYNGLDGFGMNGTSFANAAAAGYWARLRSDPRYRPIFWARAAEGWHLRGLFGQDVTEVGAGVAQSLMSTVTGAYARYWDVFNDSFLSTALGKKDDIESGGPLGRALPFSGYSNGDYDSDAGFFNDGCHYPFLSEFYEYNFEPPGGIQVQYLLTSWALQERVIGAIPPDNWNTILSGWWFQLPTTSLAVTGPNEIEGRFRRSMAWGLLPWRTFPLDWSPCNSA